MRCYRARALLSDYVDGRMPMAAAQQLHGHLEACAGCRSAWQELVALKHVLAAARTPRAPEAFWAQARRRLQGEALVAARRRERGGQRWWEVAWQRAPALVAGTAAFLTVVLIPLSIGLDRQDTPTLDTHAALAQHVAYADHFPLTDRRSLDYVVQEARGQVLD